VCNLRELRAQRLVESPCKFDFALDPVDFTFFGFALAAGYAMDFSELEPHRDFSSGHCF
jgi:hypothetical protein